ncbi:MAG: amino acid adenylation domain-containing protein, partial [Chitinophagaceae bacterium]
LDYNANRYTTEIIERLAVHLNRILEHIISNAGSQIADIEMISEEEKHQLLIEVNNTTVDYPVNETIMDLFDRQAEKTPEYIALRYENKSMTYGELRNKTDKIATYLREKENISAGDLVGIMLERDENLIPIIFGILKAGAAYIPIDPLYPAERINSILQDARPKLLITQEKYRHPDLRIEARCWDLDKELDAINNYHIGHPIKLNGADLAYIMYTSGSTGMPKGVMIAHHSLVNLILWGQQEYPIGQKDVLLQKTPIVFDVSDWEIFWWACTGASLCILKPGAEKEPLEIIKAIKDNKVTVVQFVPSMLQAFLSFFDGQFSSEDLASLRIVFASGEALKPGCADLFATSLFKNCKTRLINVYGPTEVTVDASFYECNLNNALITVPIGKPINNTRLHVLDKMDHLCPIGIEGELCVAGVGLAIGYLNNEELTRQKFKEDSKIIGERIYRTGDLVKRLPDGNLEFRGRSDEQVKIRGYRIEPGEIEQQLLSHAQVQQAVVVAREGQGDKYLVAYYVSGEEPDSAILRSYLQSRLPEYMVPAYFVRIEHLPLTVNGKLDRKALPDPQLNSTEEYIPPGSPEEKLLWEIWSKVLGTEQTGVTDNFFSAGGDSIKAIQISSRLRSAGYEVSVKDIFDHQTIRQLAPRLKTLVTVYDQSVVSGSSSLSPVQHWFLESSIAGKHHFNQSVLLHFTEWVPGEEIRKIFEKLQLHHDALRMVLRGQEGVMQVETLADMRVSLEVVDLRKEEQPSASLSLHASRIQSGIDLEKGPLLKLGLFYMSDGCHLLVVIHHLVVDGVSWRILLEDIEQLYQQVRTGVPLSLPLKTASYQSWPGYLQEYMQHAGYEQGRSYWSNNNFSLSLQRDHEQGPGRVSSQRSVSLRLSKEETRRLLSEVHSAFHTQINDVLLTGFLLGVEKEYGSRAVQIDMEGHGREPVIPGVSFSRTVGWFTSIYPVIIEKKGNELSAVIRHIKETLRSVPHNGLDYLLYQYYDGSERKQNKRSQVSFNYLGQFDADTQGKTYSISGEKKGEEFFSGGNMLYDWSVSGQV